MQNDPPLVFLKWVLGISSQPIPMSRNKTVPYCVGKWLPSDQAILDAWLKNLLEEVEGPRQDPRGAEADAREEDG